MNLRFKKLFNICVIVITFIIVLFWFIKANITKGILGSYFSLNLDFIIVIYHLLVVFFYIISRNNLVKFLKSIKAFLICLALMDIFLLISVIPDFEIVNKTDNYIVTRESLHECKITSYNKKITCISPNTVVYEKCSSIEYDNQKDSFKYDCFYNPINNKIYIFHIGNKKSKISSYNLSNVKYNLFL